MEVDKSKMVDSTGKPLTQSLFLETGYNDFAIYTLKDQDFEYEGRLLPSIKRLYLELEDVTEYEFANLYFINWNHWQRICRNKIMTPRVEEWRNELEYKLRARGIKAMIKSAKDGNYQAAKWLSDKGWDKHEAGRPSKEDLEKERKLQLRLEEDYSSDVIRLVNNNG